MGPNLGKLAGAEEAVRECMEIPEEYDEYEYYDWEYYDYEYDYLEEAEGSHRVRRDAGKDSGTGKGGKKINKGEKKTSKGRKNNKKKGAKKGRKKTSKDKKNSNSRKKGAKNKNRTY